MRRKRSKNETAQSTETFWGLIYVRHLYDHKDKTTTFPLKIEIFEENKAGQDRKLKNIRRHLWMFLWFSDVIRI